MARKPKAKKGVRVNFTGVEGNVLIPEGSYEARVAEVTLETSDNSGNDYLKWVFETRSDDTKLNGRKLFYNTSLQPQALWNLRNLLETLGVEIPDDEMDLELEEYVGLTLVVSVEHEKYEGKNRPRVIDFSPSTETEEASAEDDEEEEEEKPAKKTAAKKKAANSNGEAEEEEDDSDEDDADEDDDDKLEASEVEAMDSDELNDLIKKHSLPRRLRKIQALPRKQAAVIDALEQANLIS